MPQASRLVLCTSQEADNVGSKAPIPGTAAHELKQAQSAEVKLSHEGLCLHHHR